MEGVGRLLLVQTKAEIQTLTFLHYKKTHLNLSISEVTESILNLLGKHTIDNIVVWEISLLQIPEKPFCCYKKNGRQSHKSISAKILSTEPQTCTNMLA